MPVKSSQALLLEQVPLFLKSEKEGEPVLYKIEGERLDPDRFKKHGQPELLLPANEKDAAMKELSTCLNRHLQESIAGKGLLSVKKALCMIVEEALTPGQEKTMEALPDTIEILLDAYDKNHQVMGYLAQMSASSKVVVEHTVNVTALILQFYLFYKLEESRTMITCLSSLLHDVGTSQIDSAILEKQNRLTEKEFEIYKTHPLSGYKIITENIKIDNVVSLVALQHHERLDGSGYPHGSKDIEWESQLVGLIDSYESLTYWNKAFRKSKKPFDSLSMIKDETVAGKFSKRIFKQFTSCLTR